VTAQQSAADLLDAWIFFGGGGGDWRILRVCGDEFM
jgi:hypothetical protein